MSEKDRLKSSLGPPPPRRIPPPRPPPASSLEDTGEAEGPCPNCGAPMNAIRGSKAAVCSNCGFKDSCCF
jgi:hypothetical protein